MLMYINFIMLNTLLFFLSAFKKFCMDKYCICLIKKIFVKAKVVISMCLIIEYTVVLL